MAIAYARKLIYCRTEGNCLMSPAILAAQWPRIVINFQKSTRLLKISSKVSHPKVLALRRKKRSKVFMGMPGGVSRREASSPVAQTPLLTASRKKRPLSKPHQSSAEHSVSSSLEIAQMKHVVLILRQK